MIDLHCHLLPGIDDGAQDLAEAIGLARLAVAGGISAAVLTPHIHPGRYDNTRASIQSVFAQYVAALKRENIPLQLGMAAEVRLDADLLPAISQDQIPMLGDWQGAPVLLLELPHSHIPHGIDQFLRWLGRRGIRAMIAHPERNKAIMRDYAALKPLLDGQCLFQLTADAVAGGFGEPAQATAERLLIDGHATILASDGHNADHRPPRLTPGRLAVEKLLGDSKAWELVQTNPQVLAARHFPATESAASAP